MCHREVDFTRIYFINSYRRFQVCFTIYALDCVTLWGKHHEQRLIAWKTLSYKWLFSELVKKGLSLWNYCPNSSVFHFNSIFLIITFWLLLCLQPSFWFLFKLKMWWLKPFCFKRIQKGVWFKQSSGLSFINKWKWAQILFLIIICSM